MPEVVLRDKNARPVIAVSDDLLSLDLFGRTLQQPGASFTGPVLFPTAGLSGIGPTAALNGVQIVPSDGGAYFRVLPGRVDVNSANLTFSAAGTGDASISRLGAASLAIGSQVDGNATGSLTLGTLKASTEVQVLGSANLAFAAPGGPYFVHISSAVIDGRLVVTNGGGTAGVSLDVATDDTFKIRSRANVDDSILDVKRYSSGGSLGVVTFGPAAVTSITVKGGIVTAIS